MPDPATRGVTLVAIWALAAVALSWASLGGFWRRALALLASGVGLVFLILALQAAGLRETATTGAFLLGPSTITGKTSASASLPYYVMTGFCLLLGTAGLATSDRVAEKLSMHWLATAVCLSLLVTLLRFLLELSAAPASWAWAAGITALAPMVGAFFAVNLKAQTHGVRRLIASLLLYGIAARGFVVALMAFATTFRLGSHYDVSAWIRVVSPFTGHVQEFAPGGLSQILYLGAFPQLLFWPLYTLVAGLAGAALVRAAASVWGERFFRGSSTVGIAASRQDS